MFRRLLATGCGVLALAGIVAVAQEPERARTQNLSERAAARLEALHAEADRLAGQERTLLGDLRRLEVERDIRETELARARSEVESAAADLASLDQQVVTLTEASEAALPDLRARMVTLYKLGRGRYARLLLSASDLRQLGQAVRLVTALAQQDRQRMAEQQQRLDELTAARARATARQARLRELQGQAERAQAAASQALAAQNARIREIDTERDLNAQYAAELLSAQRSLQQSLSGLSTTTAALPIAPFKGDLDWPVNGSVRRRFGDATGGRPALRGVEIDAPEGAPVRAVHDGTVAYADEFAGYGRLVIVDHGNQTFTLYGNLGDIAVSKGMHVDQQATVGTVGPASGSAAMYFELRVDGQAVDPLQWLKEN